MQGTQEERRGCLALLAGLFGSRGDRATTTGQDHRLLETTEPVEEQPDDRAAAIGHAYRLRDDFLSPAEANLLRVLRDVTADWALVCPKVGLADLIYTPRQEDRQAALNRISRKHLDFVLCDERSLRPVLAVELDDRSHERADRRERDAFVDQVLQDVGLPLVRVPARRSYDTRELAATIAEARQHAQAGAVSRPVAPTEEGDVCPRCGGRLERRVARQGQRAGAAFLGCSNFPQCRYTAPITP